MPAAIAVGRVKAHAVWPNVWISRVIADAPATRAVIIHRPAHTDTIAVGLDIADVADPTDAPGLRGADFCSVRAGAHRRAFRVAPAITVAAEDRAVLVTRLADLRRKHRNAAEDRKSTRLNSSH